MSARRRQGPGPWVRVANAVASVLLMVLFLVHGVGNAFQLIGVGSPLGKALSHSLLATAGVHAALGVYLTLVTLRAQRSAGVAYPGLNVRFWAVRASGMAIALLMVVHVLVFWQPSAGPVRLHPFEGPELAASLLLVAAIAVHVVANAAPFMVSLGIGAPRARAADVVAVVSVLLALTAVAFVIYYLRWAVI